MRSRTSSSLSRSMACTASEAMPAARARKRRSRRSKGRPGRAIASAAAPERRRAMGASSRSSGLVGRSSRMKRARRSRSHVLVLGTAKSSRAPDASSCDTAMQPASLSNASTASRVTCRSTCWASCAALNCAASRSKKRNISSSRSTEGTVTGSYAGADTAARRLDRVAAGDIRCENGPGASLKKEIDERDAGDRDRPHPENDGLFESRLRWYVVRLEFR